MLYVIILCYQVPQAKRHPLVKFFQGKTLCYQFSAGRCGTSLGAWNVATKIAIKCPMPKDSSPIRTRYFHQAGDSPLMSGGPVEYPTLLHTPFHPGPFGEGGAKIKMKNRFKSKHDNIDGTSRGTGRVVFTAPGEIF
jgi:hypothetical protein